MTFVFLFFCSPIFRVKSQGGQCRRFCNSFSIQRLIERGIHYLIKSSHFHPNCRINKSISLCRSSLCIWYKNQSFKFSHGNTMDDSYIYKTWVVFSFKNNDLYSSVCKLMFRGEKSSICNHPINGSHIIFSAFCLWYCTQLYFNAEPNNWYFWIKCLYIRRYSKYCLR